MSGRFAHLVRDDLRVLDGYHSPQLDVEARLNVNENPYAPPPVVVSGAPEHASTNSATVA